MAGEKERVWYDLEEHPIPKDESHDWLDGDLETRVKVLRRLKPGQYVVVTATSTISADPRLHSDSNNTVYFQNYVEALRRRGFNIGKGDAEYGYKMPLPKPGDLERRLIVFRRR